MAGGALQGSRPGPHAAGRRAGTRSPRRAGRLRFRDRGRLCGESALGPEASAERLASGCHAHRAARCGVGCSGHRRCARHHGQDRPRSGGAVPAHAGAHGTLSGAAADRKPRNRRHRGRGQAQADSLRAAATGGSRGFADRSRARLPPTSRRARDSSQSGRPAGSRCRGGLPRGRRPRERRRGRRLRGPERPLRAHRRGDSWCRNHRGQAARRQGSGLVRPRFRHQGDRSAASPPGSARGFARARRPVRFGSRQIRQPRPVRLCRCQRGDEPPRRPA